jgi:hypothetical protein
MHILIKTLFTTLTFVTVAFGAPPSDDLLAGPTIQQEDVTDEDMLSRRLQETGKSNKLNSNRQQKFWLASLQSLELTNDQKIEVRAILEELKQIQQEFHKTYGKEVAELRKAHRNGMKSDNPLSDESRKRMMELLELAPEISVYQEKVWVLLTVDQKTEFQIKYQELIEEEAKRKENNKNKDQSKQKDEPSKGFGPDDSFIKERSNKLGGTINRHVDSVDETSYRRIKFLKQLQKLKEG